MSPRSCLQRICPLTHPSPQNEFVRSHPSQAWWLTAHEGGRELAGPLAQRSAVALSPHLAGTAQAREAGDDSEPEALPQEGSASRPRSAAVADREGTARSFVLDTTPRCCQGASDGHGSPDASLVGRRGSRMPAWHSCFSSYVGTEGLASSESRLMGASGQGRP